jgi:adenine-specific DNA-methyltransferase
MRKYFLHNLNVISMVECKPFDAITENEIIILKNENEISDSINFYHFEHNSIKYLNTVKKRWILSNKYFEINPYISEEINLVLSKIENNNKNLSIYTVSRRGAEIGKTDLFNTDEGVNVLVGYDVDKYRITLTSSMIDINHKEYKRLKDFFNTLNMIYLRRVSKELKASIYENPIAFNKNIYGIAITNKLINNKYLLALLNSNLLDFYYKKKFSTKKEDVFPEIQAYFYEQLPIKEIILDKQNKFIDIVNQVIKYQAINEVENAKNLQDQLDLLVYRLYDLTYSEVKVIDPDIENKISEEEYGRIEVE